ncbi:MAG: IclR family transcriptional regulator [Pseudomonadota bacterium]
MDQGDALREPRGIPTNLRLLFVLEELAKSGVPVTPTDVNQRLGLPKPTIHRLFATLEAEGFLQRELDGRSYSPGGRLRQLATHVLSSLQARTARLAIMSRLAETIGETCNLAIPDREAMTYLDRVETKWPLRIQLPVGSQVPLYCTASGKMYLSTLTRPHLERYLDRAALTARAPKTITDPAGLVEEIKTTARRGYAQDDEEFMEGMIAIAVPITDDLGRLFATLSFHAPIQRLSLEAGHAHIGTLRDAAQELEQLVRSGEA